MAPRDGWRARDSLVETVDQLLESAGRHVAGPDPRPLGVAISTRVGRPDSPVKVPRWEGLEHVGRRCRVAGSRCGATLRCRCGV